jgi:hypothetical protein
MARQWRVGQADRIIPLCKVVDIPAGSPPLDVVVELPDPDGTRTLARWFGRPAIEVDDYVRLQRRGADGLYDLVGIDGDAAETIDHGGLEGLGDDDHSQYLLAGGSRAGATGQAQDFGANGILADEIAESTGSAGVTVSSDLAHTGSNLGFYGSTPTTQPAALTGQETGITASAPGTPDYAIANPGAGGYGFSTADEFLTVMAVIANLQTRLQELEDRLQALGLLG